MLSDDRRLQLAEALEAAFPDGPSELHMLASLYVTAGLARRLPANPSLASMVQAIVAADEEVLESVLRAARRRRPGRSRLVRVIADVWPFADGIDFACVDDLRKLLDDADVSNDELREVARAVVGVERVPLWDCRGPEPRGDLLEGLAQLQELPLRLMQVAQHFRHHPGVAAWLEQRAPRAIGSIEPVRPGPVFRCRRRMLIVLRRGVRNLYKGDIYFASAEKPPRPRFVAALRRQATLSNIAAVFSETRRANDDLRAALLDGDLELIEVMLPVRDMLTRVEQWDLVGSGPIGRLFPVVVRPLERAFARQYDDYIGGAMLLRSSWEVVKHAPAIRPIELDAAQVDDAALQHPQRWCVAMFRCPEPSQADRLQAIDRLVRLGVAAMLGAWHEPSDGPVASSAPAPATPPLPATAPLPVTAPLSEVAPLSGIVPLPAADHLPAAVHQYRRNPTRQPVMLLWDDAEFNPGSTK